MSRARRLLLLSLVLLGGCRGGPVKEDTDRMVLDLARHPFDQVSPAADQIKPKQEPAAPSPKATTPEGNAEAAETVTDIETVALMQAERAQEKREQGKPKLELQIPPDLPGSEAPPIRFSGDMTTEQKR